VPCESCKSELLQSRRFCDSRVIDRGLRVRVQANQCRLSELAKCTLCPWITLHALERCAFMSRPDALSIGRRNEDYTKARPSSINVVQDFDKISAPQTLWIEFIVKHSQSSIPKNISEPQSKYFAHRRQKKARHRTFRETLRPQVRARPMAELPPPLTPAVPSAHEDQRVPAAEY
jgi:hypothetical protein